MAAPNTKLWTARENNHKEAGGWHVIVGGQVECGYHEAPELRETKGDGSTLSLDLTLEVQEAKPVTDASGAPLKMPPVWKAVKYHRQVDANQFKAVAIRWQNDGFATVPVIDDREHQALMTKQTKAQNLLHGSKNVLNAAGKVAAAAKKGTKTAKTTAVKKAAKKTAKKVAKKAAKTKAKKAAKKSVLKGLMKKLVKKVKKLAPKKSASKKSAAKKKKKGKR